MVRLKSKNIILRPNTEWYSDELRAAKRDRRKAERRMRKSNLTVHREMFRDSCLKANTLLLKCKKDYLLIDDGTKFRVVQFHNIYNRSFTILENFTSVQILNLVNCVEFTKFAVRRGVALFRRL
jgi:nicotinamide riboside kinase